MRIGIIGSGNIGAAAARRFVDVGPRQPGSPIFTRNMTARDARAALGALARR